MNDRVDSYISLHFQDLAMPAGGGKEDFVATVAEGEVEELRNVAGVEVQHAFGIPGEPKAMVAITATPTGRRKLFESGRVQAMQATTRRERIPVLLHLKRADWNGNIPGLETGSRLGRILSAMANAQAIEALAKDPDVVSIEASRNAGVAECATSMPWIGVPTVQATYSEKGAGAIVAIIDGGIDVLHQAFRKGDQSRILAIWDQRDNAGPTPAAVNPAIYQQQSYGTLHTRADISQYIAANAVGKNLGRDPIGHGTHVASIAAGSPLPAVNFPGGVAPEADIVVVIPQLSAAAGDPVSLGYSKAHLLHAAQRGLPVFAESLRLLVEGLRLFKSKSPNNEEVMKSLATMEAYLWAADAGEEFVSFRGFEPNAPGSQSSQIAMSREDWSFQWDNNI